MADHDPAPPASQDDPRLLRLASHELRTPLTVVAGYLRMLQRDTDHPLDERQRTIVAEADKACQKMAALVADLHVIAMLDAGQVTLSKEPFDLCALLQEVAADADEAADRGVRLTLGGIDLNAWMLGDRERLQRALAALVRAVLREQQDSTSVLAECRRTRDDDHSAMLIVVGREGDTTLASAAAPAPVDETRGGLGLALPIARRVIELHGGRVWSPVGADGAVTTRGAILVALPLAR